jgi:hypothetical protein
VERDPARRGLVSGAEHGRRDAHARERVHRGVLQAAEDAAAGPAQRARGGASDEGSSGEGGGAHAGGDIKQEAEVLCATLQTRAFYGARRGIAGRRPFCVRGARKLIVSQCAE